MNTPTNIERSCLVCGVIFYKKNSESKNYWKTKKFCSRKCSLTKTSLISLGVQYKTPKGKIPWNKYLKYSPELKLRLNITGLKIGQGLFKGKKLPQFSGENHPNWKPKIEVLCSHCSKKILKQPNEARYKRYFCNRICWAQGTRGRGSPVFLGEFAIKSLRLRIAELPEYKSWHAKILSRDGYKCILCFSKQTKKNPLEVDHIKRFRSIVLENNIITTEQARNCFELWKVENGRTLCRECHRKTDTYGTKNLRKFKKT